MTRRRTFVTKLGAVLSASGLSLIPFKGRAHDTTGRFYHVVYFWLKEPDNEAKNVRFLKSLNSFLDEVEVIQTKHVGTPAGTDREVIDSSYTFSLVATFKNKQDQDIYQEHASHKRFISESQGLWSKVQVYDSIAI